MTELIRGYWCECWTEDLTGTRRPALLASIDTYAATQAVRWIAVALRTIISALEPSASAEAWIWLDEGRMATTRALLCAEPCSVSVDNATTRITWTARPVSFLPLAHRQGAELPACSEQFKPHASHPEPH